MIITDTDVLIDFLCGQRPGADRVAFELQHGSLSTTVITRFELLSGILPGKTGRQVEQLLEALPCLSLNAESSDLAAQVRRKLCAAGREIGMGDSLIAGIVLKNKGILMTRNKKHFSRVDGLRLAELPGA
jgi:predicted nucleic acid-binding protein